MNSDRGTVVSVVVNSSVLYSTAAMMFLNSTLPDSELNAIPGMGRIGAQDYSVVHGDQYTDRVSILYKG